MLFDNKFVEPHLGVTVILQYSSLLRIWTVAGLDCQLRGDLNFSPLGMGGGNFFNTEGLENGLGRC